MSVDEKIEIIQKLQPGKIQVTSEECPGSAAAGGQNYHKLWCIGDSLKKMCLNGKCYFAYIDENQVSNWQTGFDPIIAKSFVKPSKEKDEK